jgi:hypothetical protein
MFGAIPPLPQYVFKAWGLVKHRENFIFTFITEIATVFVRNAKAVWKVRGLTLVLRVGTL